MNMDSFYIDNNRDGVLVLRNPKTTKRYHELAYGNNAHPDAHAFGVFWAFTKEQFEEGYKDLVARGFIKDGDKLCRTGETGLLGTRECIRAFFAAYDDRDKIIAKECDAQEVYCVEYNNHECMFDSWEGDLNAIKLIISIFGADVAKTIKRVNPVLSVDDIISNKPL